MKNLLKRLDSRLEVVSVVDKSDRVEFVAFLSSSSASCPQLASVPLNITALICVNFQTFLWKHVRSLFM